MKVYVEPSPALPIVSVAIGFRSGAVNDPFGKEGLARTTARMLRRGSEGRSAEQTEEAIDALGGEFGADVSVSASNVHAEVISRKLDAFVDLVSEVLGAPSFDEVELGKLVREAQAEIVESRDSDRALAGRALRRTLFDRHLYGRRVAGSLASLERIGTTDVRDFYARHYCRANAIVAISGDVSHATAREIAERLLSRLPEGSPTPDPVDDPSPKAGRHLVFVDKPDRTQMQMLVGGLGTSARDDDHLAVIVGNTAFGGTFTSRLMQEVRAKRGWSYGAYSRAGFDRHRDAFTMSAAPGTKDAAACLALMLELLAEVRKNGLTQDEVAFVKSYLQRSHAFEIDTARKRVHQRLEEALFDLPEGYHTSYLERLEALDTDTINAALRRRLPEDDLVIAVVGTNAESGQAIADAIPGLASTTVAPFDLE
jgi:zinc protease